MSDAGARVAVTGVGFICAVGTGATEACAAARAGLSRVAASPYLCARTSAGGPPLEYARVATAPLAEEGSERLERLLATAFDELVRTTHIGRREFAQAPLRVALPSMAPPESAAPAERLAALSTRARWPNARVLLAPHGQAGMLGAIADALDELARGECVRALVAGVEPEPSLARLAALDAAGRLRSAGEHDGFTPGEAATALLLERADAAAGREPRAFVERAAYAAGSGAIEAEPLAGVLGRAGVGGLDWVVCDLNGESARSRAWGIAATRAGGGLAAARVFHPAVSWGDVGSATGGALVALALHAWARRYAPLPRALVWAQSDDGSAGAVRLRAPLP